MYLLIAFGLFTTTFAAPQGYIIPETGTFQHGGEALGRYATPGGNSETSLGGGYQIGDHTSSASCGENQIRNIDGSCVQPIITRNIFHYSAPQLHFQPNEVPEIPEPKINYNIVFVRTPEFQEGQTPIVVPPPQQKTLVYVLIKGGVLGEQQVIEIPTVPQTPEVYYVNYDEGDNPSLPGVIDLQSALASASQQQGQIIGGSGSNVDIHSGTSSVSFESGLSLLEGSHTGAPFGDGSIEEVLLPQTYGTPSS